MRHQNFQPGKIDGHIVQINRVAKLVPRRRKDRRPGMDHHRNSIGLCCAINRLQFFHAVQVIIGIKQLVRRMDLDQPDAQAHELVHFFLDIQRVPRMHAAARKLPLRIFLAIIRHPRIHFMRESHCLRSNVINEHRALNRQLNPYTSAAPWATGILQDVLIMAARLFITSSGPALNISTGWIWMWQSVISIYFWLFQPAGPTLRDATLFYALNRLNGYQVLTEFF